MADDGETARINFVQSVPWCVPISSLNIEVDDIAPSDTSPNERKMVIAASSSAV
jgi:hypothetical protein